MTERRAYTRSGLNALKARVKVRGLGAIDRRTAAARELITWRAALIADLGGEARLTAAKRALVDVAARSRLFLEHVDAALLERSSLVTRRHRLLPLLEQRQRLADQLARALDQLGLERAPERQPSVADVLRGRT